MSGALTHSPEKIIQQLIIDLGHGTDPADSGDWPVYVAHKPDAPDSIIVVLGTSDVQQGRAMTDGRRQVSHGFQVTVRDPDHSGAHTKAEAIAIAFDEDVVLTAVTVDSTGYIVYSITRTSGPLGIGKEEGTRRDIFTYNARAALRQPS